MSRQRIKVGVVAVASGQVIIIDPCCLGNWKHGEFIPPVDQPPANHYDEACQITASGLGHGQMKSFHAVVSSTGVGDGIYPVYATVRADGTIANLTIQFC
jgi:Protein of unknown function (DUF4241)